MSKTDIFLSYARQDQATARMFAECLGEEGFSVWWDASLRSGETFDEVIERQLRDAKAVVVLWSPASVASRWVRAEATLADRRNKLAPAIIQPCDRPIKFELTHAAELSDWTGDMTDPRWKTFVSDLHGLTDIGSEADQAAAVENDEEVPAPAPQARQTLRPGNDEVIVVDPVMRTPHVQRPPARELPAEDSPSQGEVHCLEVEDPALAGELVVVESSGMKIGRSAPADAILSHASISREHCLIGLANDELFVTDLNSTNGTYIDDVRIRRATLLPLGSVLRLGQISMRHCLRPAADVPDSLGEAGETESPRAGRLAAAS